MTVYVALLRGINVGGNTMLKMADLKLQLEKAGMQRVKTYINSGNIIFASDKKSDELTSIIEALIVKEFKLPVPAVVLSLNEYQKIIADLPSDWGVNTEWKYNLLFVLPGTKPEDIVAEIGEIKTDIETLVPGHKVVYQSVSFKDFGKSRFSRIVGKPAYKRMTVRNHRTGYKLLELMEGSQTSD